jgi:hypothetical protein
MSIIKYSCQGFIVCGILKLVKVKIEGYCYCQKKEYNSYNLFFFGKEDSDIALAAFKHRSVLLRMNVILANLFT